MFTACQTDGKLLESRFVAQKSKPYERGEKAKTMISHAVLSEQGYWGHVGTNT